MTTAPYPFPKSMPTPMLSTYGGSSGVLVVGSVVVSPGLLDVDVGLTEEDVPSDEFELEVVVTLEADVDVLLGASVVVLAGSDEVEVSSDTEEVGGAVVDVSSATAAGAVAMVIRALASTAPARGPRGLRKILSRNVRPSPP